MKSSSRRINGSCKQSDRPPWKLNNSKWKSAVLNPSKSFLAWKKVNPRILSTFKRSFSKKMGKKPSSHIIHSLGGEYRWIVWDREPIRLLKSPRSLLTQVIHTNSESRKQPQRHNNKAQRLISDTYALMQKSVKQYVVGNLWCKTWSNRLNNQYSSKWNKLFCSPWGQEQGATNVDCKLANRRVNKVNSAMTWFKNYLHPWT